MAASLTEVFLFYLGIEQNFFPNKNNIGSFNEILVPATLALLNELSILCISTFSKFIKTNWIHIHPKK